MAQALAHVALVVRDYDEAIAWFTDMLGFALVADEYQPEQDKRWVLVAPPGSPPGGASLLLARASTAAQAAFVGDALFKAGVGRWDLPGGNFDLLAKSIREQIYTLPDETVVLPGHGPRTSVGAEKLGNPYVAAVAR